MSSPVVTNNVIDVPLVIDKKTKKPRAKTIPESAPKSDIHTDAHVDTLKDKKTKQKNTKKNTEPVVSESSVSEPVVSEQVVTEQVVTEQVVTEQVVTDKKSRKPALSAKFNKFLQFGYYLAQSLKDSEGNLAINSVDDLIMRLHLFDTVDNQQSFVQGFFDQSKDINKSIRKIIADKKKADAKAFKLANKPPKNNKNKNFLSNNLDPLVSDIVSLANHKPKRKYNKKINNQISDNNILTDNNNHDELDVEIFVIDNVQYLIDSNKRVFHFHNHNLIGFLDSNNLLSIY
jgi:hypothetical protein